MNRRVEKYFPDILALTEKHFKEEIKGGGIPSVYKSYISTFGAMIVENGLLPALAFFEKKDSAAEEKRDKIIDVLREFLENRDVNLKGSKDKTLANLLVDKIKNKTLTKDQLREIESKVIDASIALKLSLRTFLKKER